MNIIQKLINDNYSIFNLTMDKNPANINGNRLKDWNKLSSEDLKKHHNIDSKRWGLRTGLQDNGKYIMSIDFDCCGESNKDGIRTGCNFTKQKLEEYMSFNIPDGMYSSSTEGNMNVLIDYTNCNELIKLFHNKSKFNNHCIEFLVGNGHQQAIPPTTSVCKITGKIGKQRKFFNNKPFYILDNDINNQVFQFIKNLIFVKIDIKLNKNIPINNSLPDIQNNNSLPNIKNYNTDKYIDLIFNVITNKNKLDWDDWFLIAGILKHNNYDKNIFLDFSKPYDINNKASSLWDGIKNISTMSIFGLQNLAKRINNTGYHNWLIKFSECITIDILEKGENDIAKFIAPQLKDELVFYHKIWYVNNNNTKLWEIIQDPSALVITKIQSCLSLSEGITCIKHSNDILNAITQDDKNKLTEEHHKKCKKYKDYYRYISSSSMSSQIIKLLKSYLSNNNFTQSLDSIPYSVAFKNGILDLKTLNFRYGISSTDFLTNTIPFDYEIPNEKDKTYITEQLLKTCNNNPIHLNYFLSVLGYSMTGDSSIKQEFYFLRGEKGSNGKSLIFEVLSDLIPNYVIKVENNVFEKNNNQKHKDIARWKGFRIAWLNELTHNQQDTEFIKNIADGTSIPYKVMYGITENMPISFKLFFISNHTIDIPVDGGIKRRCKTLQFDSEFINDLDVEIPDKCLFKKDESFRTNILNNYKHAFLQIIFEYSHKFYLNNFKLENYPLEWNIENNEVLENNNKFLKWFNDYFEIGNDFKIGKKELDDLLKQFGKIIFKDEVKKNKWNFTYVSQERYESSVKGTWYGFRYYIETPIKTNL